VDNKISKETKHNKKSKEEIKLEKLDKKRVSAVNTNSNA